MWPSDRPLPIGGMPCRSTNVMNASSWRLMIANEWSVPRWSCHISIGATGTRVRVDRHDRRVLAAHADRDDLGRRGRVRGRELAHRVDELVPQLDRVLLGGARARARRRAAAARCRSRVASSATSTTFRFVVPTSIPIAHGIARILAAFAVTRRAFADRPAGAAVCCQRSVPVGLACLFAAGWPSVVGVAGVMRCDHRSFTGPRDQCPTAVCLEIVVVGAERVELVEPRVFGLGPLDAVIVLHELGPVAASAVQVGDLHHNAACCATVGARPRCVTLITSTPLVMTSFRSRRRAARAHG